MLAKAMIQEDPLTYLPRRPVQEFARGQKIYDARQDDDRLYVAMSGRVKISCIAEDGSETVNQILGPEELFGESCLIAPKRPAEVATALDKTATMAWRREEIEAQVEKEPRLGVALLQYFAERSIGLQCRLQSMAVYKTPERVVLSLVRLAEDLGAQTADGALRVAPLTHQTIADYVGTSREIITSEMNRLRRAGMVRYSRKYIDVFAAALRETLRQSDIRVPMRVIEKYQTV